MKNIVILILLSIVGCTSLKTNEAKSYIIQNIDTNIFWDCNLIILKDANSADSTMCDIILITSKLDSFEKPDFSYVKIELKMAVQLHLKNDNRFRSKRKSDKTRNNSSYRTFPADSLMTFAYGDYPCIKIIWDNYHFTDEVKYCDEIIDLYFRKE